DGEEPADTVDIDLEAALDDLGRAGLDDDAAPEGLPTRLDRGPLEAEDLDPFIGVEPIDDDLDGRARRGDLRPFELLDRQDAFALASHVDEQRLAADADDPAGPLAWAPLLAPQLGRMG